MRSGEHAPGRAANSKAQRWGQGAVKEKGDQFGGEYCAEVSSNAKSLHAHERKKPTGLQRVCAVQGFLCEVTVPMKRCLRVTNNGDKSGQT